MQSKPGSPLGSQARSDKPLVHGAPYGQGELKDSAVAHVKKIETFEEGLAKIVELENELQKAKEQLSDAKTHRWMLVNLLRLIFVLYASCTCPGGWLLGLLLGTLLVVIGWAMWRTAERNSW